MVAAVVMIRPATKKRWDIRNMKGGVYRGREARRFIPIPAAARRAAMNPPPGAL